MNEREFKDEVIPLFKDKYKGSLLIEEKLIHKSICDLGLFHPDYFVGVEIKSDLDTTTRLKRQVKSYNKVFDYNWICFGVKHEKSVKKIAPKSWGLISLEKDDDKSEYTIVKFIREAKRNLGVSKKDIIALLWKSELADLILEVSRGKYKVNEIYSQRVSELRDYALRHIPLQEIKNKFYYSYDQRERFE